MSFAKIPKRVRAGLLIDAGMQKVFELCQEVKPTHDWSMAGNRIRGKCIFPGHNDNTPSMDLVFDDSYTFLKCLGCGQCETDSLRIVSLITGVTSATQVLNDVFSQRFALKLPEELNEAIEQEEHYQVLKRQLLVAGQATLGAGVSQTGGEFAYIQDAVHYLRSRNIDLSMLPLYGIGVFPTLKHMQDYGDISYITDLNEYLGPRVFDTRPMATGRYGGWLMFPYHTDPRAIGRLKLRNPKNKAEETWLGRFSKEPRGFFGFHLSAMHVGGSTDQSQTAYIVEGEFDQLSLAQEQSIVNANEHYITLCTSGGGSCDLDPLREAGIRRVVAIPDNDDGGISFVRNILRASSEAVTRNMTVFKWEAPFLQKDPDEVVLGGQYQPFWASVTASSSQTELNEWAAEQAHNEVVQIPHARTVQKIEIVNKYAQLLKDELIRDLYVTDVATMVGVDRTLLTKHVARNDTERGFRLNVERMLHDHMDPVAYVTSERALLYSRKDEEIFEVSLRQPRVMELALQSRVFHMKAFEFIESTVGIPDWIQYDSSGKATTERSTTAQAKLLEPHLDWAVQNLIATAGPMSRYSVMRQGVHYADATRDPEDAELLPKDFSKQRVYVVNGPKIYVGSPGDGDEAEFSVLPGPAHGACLLWGERGAHWSEHLWDVNAIKQPAPMSIDSVYEILVDMINIGWEFDRKDLVSKYIAANLITITIGDVFDYLPQAFFTATTQSGKSTLLKGIYGGKEPSSLHVLEHCKYYEDYTAAGIMQGANGSTLMHAMDEWENPDSAKAKSSGKARAVQSLLEMTRNLSSGMERTRGGQDGQATSVYLRFPIMAAGIYPHQDRVDLNRWFTFELKTVEGRASPESIITQKYSAETIADVRKSVTLLSIQNAFKLKQIEKSLYDDIFYQNKIEVPSTRFAKAALSIASGLRWVGEDALTYTEDLVAYAHSYISRADMTDEEGLLRAVFETNGVRLEPSSPPQSVLTILADLQWRDKLSYADTGVYHLSGTDVVVIYCAKLPALLRNSAAYRNTTNTNQLFTLLRRNKIVHHNPTYFLNNPAVLQHLRGFIAHPRVEEFLYVKLADLAFSNAPLVSPTINDEADV